MSTLKLYGPEFSYFLRSVRLLCQFKGLAYEVTRAPYGKEIPILGDEHASLHPFRKLPVLIDGDLVLPETMAIAFYLESKPGPSFLPGSTEGKAKILAQAGIISLYAHQHLVKNLLLEFAFPKGDQGNVRIDVVKDNLPAAQNAMRWIADSVGSAQYFIAGQFTLCDAYLIPMLDYIDQLPEPFCINKHYANLNDYLAFQRAQTYAEGVLGARKA